ncbi:MAG: 16S rRNA (adenine(1518)-N(6)/adenine(1519)-N(6))-dimethyltransferase RsmA [Planctomycetota bacterium]
MSGASDLRAAVEALRAAGFRPTKTRGQNFLVDSNVLAAIVRDAGVQPGDRVIEVGVGLGFLTGALLAAGATVTGLEIDPELAALARAGHAAGAEVLVGDALSSKNRLGPELASALSAEPWHLVANLPYSISGPLLVLLARSASPPVSMTVLVQRELAERVAAPPAAPDRGPLGVRLQLDHTVRLGRAVPPTVFWPRPRVESAVVHLERHRRLPPAEVEAFDRLVGALFQSRRKALRAALVPLAGGGAAADALLLRAGLEPRRRAEELTGAELEALARAVSP